MSKQSAAMEGLGPKRKSSAGILDPLFNMDHLTNGQFPLKWVIRLVYIALLTWIYIYYSMLADAKIHQIARATAALEEVRADYTTQKAEFMKLSKQSYLEVEMRKYGLELSLVPPTKIIIDQPLDTEDWDGKGT